ncbi:MAG: hypothetical protein ACFBSE_14310 [Prochloraceae cyanobacterium]
MKNITTKAITKRENSKVIVIVYSIEMINSLEELRPTALGLY